MLAVAKLILLQRSTHQYTRNLCVIGLIVGRLLRSPIVCIANTDLSQNTR